MSSSNTPAAPELLIDSSAPVKHRPGQPRKILLEVLAEQTQDQTLEISQLADKPETKKYVFLTANDRLSFVRQCVAYQEDHKHG